MPAAERAPQRWTARATVRPAGAFEGPQGQRQEDGGPAEQVPAALEEPVRSQLEREPPERGRERRQLQLAEPEVGEEPGRERDEQEEQVPGGDRPEERVERPVGHPVGPAAEDHLRLDERLEAVGVDPGRVAALELVADEPEPVGRLEVVARGRLAVPGLASLRHELGAQPGDGRKGRDDGRDREERQ